MKRLITLIIMLATVFVCEAQYLGDGVYYRQLKKNRPSRYVNVSGRNSRISTNISTKKIPSERPIENTEPLHTVSEEQYSADLTALTARMDKLENDMKKSNIQQPVVGDSEKKWTSKYTSGDCLIKSGRFQYISIGTVLLGGAVTYGLARASVDDSSSGDEFKYAAYTTGIVTGALAFLFYTKSIKWKIRAGKKINMELQMKADGIALNF